MMCGPDMTASGAEITVSRLEMIVAGFLIIISAAEISICVAEINISEAETIAGVPPIIVSGIKMSVSGPEMIIGLSPIMISLAETIVSLTDLTAGATAMTVSESSMGVDEGEIIVNETELTAFVWTFIFRFMPLYRAAPNTARTFIRQRCPSVCDTESLFGIGKPDPLCDSFRFRLLEVLMQIQTPHPHSFLQGAGRTTFSPRPSTASNEWLGFRNYSVLPSGLCRSETLSYFAFVNIYEVFTLPYTVLIARYGERRGGIHCPAI